MHARSECRCVSRTCRTKRFRLSDELGARLCFTFSLVKYDECNSLRSPRSARPIIRYLLIEVFLVHGQGTRSEFAKRKTRTSGNHSSITSFLCEYQTGESVALRTNISVRTISQSLFIAGQDVSFRNSYFGKEEEEMLLS